MYKTLITKMCPSPCFDHSLIDVLFQKLLEIIKFDVMHVDNPEREIDFQTVLKIGSIGCQGHFLEGYNNIFFFLNGQF